MTTNGRIKKGEKERIIDEDNLCDDWVRVDPLLGIVGECRDNDGGEKRGENDEEKIDDDNTCLFLDL